MIYYTDTELVGSTNFALLTFGTRQKKNKIRLSKFLIFKVIELRVDHLLTAISLHL